MLSKILIGCAVAAAFGSAYAATDYPSGYTKCAQIGGACTMSGTHSVALGKSGSFVYATLTGNFTCTASLFPASSYGSSAWCSIGPAATSSSSSVASSSKSSSSVSSSTSSSTSSVSSSASSSVSSTGPSGAFGYGAAATGGAGGATVTVTNYADLVKYASVYDPTPRIIKIQGTISGATGMVKVGSNKTIIGLPGSVLNGFGLDVNGWTPELAALNPAKNGAGCDPDVIGVDGLTPVKYPDGSVKPFPLVKNVIIRNVTSRNSQDDGFDVACMANTVWLDHNTVESPCDGYTDIKRGADNVTVSWNHYKYTAGQNTNSSEFSGDSCEQEKGKTMLIGHETSSTAELQSKGRLHVTVSHNWFDNTIQRHPRVRYGTVHVVNNYGVLSTSSQYFVGISNLANIYVENNSIINTDNPCKDFESASTSNITFVNNNVAGLKSSTAGQNLACSTSAKLGAAAKPSYSYGLDALSNVPAVVQQGAGAGVIAIQ